MIKTYYDVCAYIDLHNRQHQGDLELERIVKTVTWWKRVCISVYWVIVVDTANVYSKVVHKSEVDESPYCFFTNLANEMVVDDIEIPVSQIRQGMHRHSPGSTGTGIPPQNNVALTPSKKMRINSDKHTFSGLLKY